jgi:hypothetical protein
VAVAPLPASVLMPIAPAAAPQGGMQRRLLVAGLLGGLLLLTGSTALALHLAVRADSKRDQVNFAAVDAPPSGTGPAHAPVVPPATQLPEQGQDLLDRPPPRTNVRPPSPDRPRDHRSPALAPPQPARVKGERGVLPPEMQKMVNKAIDEGVACLLKNQLVNGAWDNRHTTGLAALPGLTLLECGVPASDPRVLKAARFVRSHTSRLVERVASLSSPTYELSLALLFLDRLGDPNDRPLIRTIALRLVAGQLPDGGWSYAIPVLRPDDEDKLLRFLEQARPPRALDRFVPKPGDGKVLDRPQRMPDGRPGPLDRFVPTEGSPGKPGDSPGSTRPLDRDRPDVPPAPKEKPAPAPANDRGKEPKRPLSDAEVKKAFNDLPLPLRRLPVLRRAVGKSLGTPGRPMADNSNTQFATLALWAAQRHGLPLERSLDLLALRFRKTQKADGTWKYRPGWKDDSPAMTGVGLLGLAVGHGLDADPARRKKVQDAGIDKGLKALGQSVGKPLGADFRRDMKRNRKGRIVGTRARSPINLYLLWTVERVGVLYQVREMNGKDWYRWGVELLLDAQADDGSWFAEGYPGSTRPIDTCFALLFLKRANLSADLTKKLDFVVEGKPASSPGG